MKWIAAPGIAGLLCSLALAQSTMPRRFPAVAPIASAQHTPSSPLSTQPAQLPASPVPLGEVIVENLESFEPRDVKLTWQNRHWLLTHHGRVLKDFGIREQEARLALRSIQELRLNQYGTVGSPPIMEYWLCDGVAPHPQARLGLRALPLETAKLEAAEVQGQWCLREGQRVLFAFGKKGDDARQALAVVRKYHFDQVGIIGQPTPTMYVFMSPHSHETPTLTKHRPATNTRELIAPKFSRIAKNSDGSLKREASRTPSPVAGLVVPSLPPIAKQPTAREPVAMQSSLSARQVPLWKPQTPLGISPPSQQERLAFDWRQVQLRQDGLDWKLVAGGQVLGNFGANAHEARLALTAIRHYRFTEQHRLGGDRPVVRYCASLPQSPRGVLLGLPSETIAPDKVEVRREGGDFVLCSGQQVVLRLGERGDEAKRLMEVIKTNKYDRLSQIGEPSKEGVTLLIRSH